MYFIQNFYSEYIYACYFHLSTGFLAQTFGVVWPSDPPLKVAHNLIQNLDQKREKQLINLGLSVATR